MRARIKTQIPSHQSQKEDGASPHFPNSYIISSQVCGIVVADGGKAGTLGGVTMHEMELTAGKTGIGEIARILVGVALLVLVVGIWVCLWVPPTPSF
jgi:hypothetical protein